MQELIAYGLPGLGLYSLVVYVAFRTLLKKRGEIKKTNHKCHCENDNQSVGLSG